MRMDGDPHVTAWGSLESKPLGGQRAMDLMPPQPVVGGYYLMAEEKGCVTRLDKPERQGGIVAVLPQLPGVIEGSAGAGDENSALACLNSYHSLQMPPLIDVPLCPASLDYNVISRSASPQDDPIPDVRQLIIPVPVLSPKTSLLPRVSAPSAPNEHNGWLDEVPQVTGNTQDENHRPLMFDYVSFKTDQNYSSNSDLPRINAPTPFPEGHWVSGSDKSPQTDSDSESDLDSGALELPLPESRRDSGDMKSEPDLDFDTLELLQSELNLVAGFENVSRLQSNWDPNCLTLSQSKSILDLPESKSDVDMSQFKPDLDSECLKLPQSESDLDSGSEHSLQSQSSWDPSSIKSPQSDSDVDSGFLNLAQSESDLDSGSLNLPRSESDLDSGSSNLPQSESDLDSGCLNLPQSESDLDSGCLNLPHSESDLDSGSLNLPRSESDLDSGSSNLPQSDSDLDSGSLNLPRSESDLDSGSLNLPQSESDLDSGSLNLPRSESDLDSGSSNLPRSESHLDSGFLNLSQSESDLDAGSSNLPQSESDLDSGFLELPKCEVDLDSGSLNLPRSESDLDSGSSNLPQSESDLDSGSLNLPRSESDLDSGFLELPKCEVDLDSGSLNLPRSESDLDSGSSNLPQSESDLDFGSLNLPRSESDMDSGSLNLPRSESDLDSGSLNLPRSESDLDSGSSNLPQSESDLDSGSLNLPRSESDMDSGSLNLPRSESDMDSGSLNLPRSESDLDSGSLNLPRSESDLDSGSSNLPQSESDLDSGSLNLPRSESDMDSGSLNLPRSESDLDSGSLNLPRSESDLDSGSLNLPRSESDLDSGSLNLPRSESDLDSGFLELPKCEVDLDSGSLHLPRSESSESNLDSGFLELPKCESDLDSGSLNLPQSDSDLDSGFLELPKCESDLDSGFLELPKSKSDLDLGTLELPESESDFDYISLKLKQSEPDLDFGSLHLPQSESDLYPGSLNFPQTKSDLDSGSLDLPQSKSGLDSGSLHLPQSESDFNFGSLHLLQSESDLDNVCLNFLQSHYEVDSTIELPKSDLDNVSLKLTQSESNVDSGFLNLPQSDYDMHSGSLELPKCDSDLGTLELPEFETDYITSKLGSGPLHFPPSESDVGSGSLHLPQSESDLDSGSLHLPQSGSDLDSGSLHLLQSESDLDSGSLHLPQSGSDLDSGSLHLLQSGSDLDSGSLHLPQSESDLDSGSLHLLKSESDLDSGSLELPKSKSDLDPGTLVLPGSESDFDYVSLKLTQSEPDLDFGSLHLPQSESDLHPGSLHLPQSESDLDSGSLHLPQSESDLDSGSLELPKSKSDLDPGTLVLPGSESDFDYVSLKLTQSEPDLDFGSLHLPQSESDLHPGSLHLPQSESDLDSGSLHLPQSESDLHPGSLHLPQSESDLDSGSLHLPQSESDLDSGSLHLPQSESDLDSGSLHLPQSESDLDSGSLHLPQSESDLDSGSLHLPQSESDLDSGSLHLPQSESDLGSGTLEIPHSESDTGVLQLPQSDSDLLQSKSKVDTENSSQSELVSYYRAVSLHSKTILESFMPLPPFQSSCLESDNDPHSSSHPNLYSDHSPQAQSHVGSGLFFLPDPVYKEDSDDDDELPESETCLQPGVSDLPEAESCVLPYLGDLPEADTSLSPGSGELPEAEACMNIDASELPESDTCLNQEFGELPEAESFAIPYMSELPEAETFMELDVGELPESEIDLETDSGSELTEADTGLTLVSEYFPLDGDQVPQSKSNLLYQTRSYWPTDCLTKSNSHLSKDLMSQYKFVLSTNLSECVLPTNLPPQSESVLPTDLSLQSESVLPTDLSLQSESVLPTDLSLQSESVLPTDLSPQSESVLSTNLVPQSESVLPTDLSSQSETVFPQSKSVLTTNLSPQSDSVLPTDLSLQSESVLPTDLSSQSESVLTTNLSPQSDSVLPTDLSLQSESVLPTDLSSQSESVLTTNLSPQSDSVLPTDLSLQSESVLPTDLSSQSESVLTTNLSPQSESVLPTDLSPQSGFVLPTKLPQSESYAGADQRPPFESYSGSDQLPQTDFNRNSDPSPVSKSELYLNPSSEQLPQFNFDIEGSEHTLQAKSCFSQYTDQLTQSVLSLDSEQLPENQSCIHPDPNQSQPYPNPHLDTDAVCIPQAEFCLSFESVQLHMSESCNHLLLPEPSLTSKGDQLPSRETCLQPELESLSKTELELDPDHDIQTLDDTNQFHHSDTFLAHNRKPLSHPSNLDPNLENCPPRDLRIEPDTDKSPKTNFQMEPKDDPFLQPESCLDSDLDQLPQTDVDSLLCLDPSRCQVLVSETNLPSAVDHFLKSEFNLDSQTEADALHQTFLADENEDLCPNPISDIGFLVSDVGQHCPGQLPPQECSLTNICDLVASTEVPLCDDSGFFCLSETFLACDLDQMPQDLSKDTNTDHISNSVLAHYCNPNPPETVLESPATDHLPGAVIVSTAHGFSPFVSCLPQNDLFLSVASSMDCLSEVQVNSSNEQFSEFETCLDDFDNGHMTNPDPSLHNCFPNLALEDDPEQYGESSSAHLSNQLPHTESFLSSDADPLHLPQCRLVANLEQLHLSELWLPTDIDQIQLDVTSMDHDAELSLLDDLFINDPNHFLLPESVDATLGNELSMFDPFLSQDQLFLSHLSGHVHEDPLHFPDSHGLNKIDSASLCKSSVLPISNHPLPEPLFEPNNDQLLESGPNLAPNSNQSESDFQSVLSSASESIQVAPEHTSFSDTVVEEFQISWDWTITRDPEFSVSDLDCGSNVCIQNDQSSIAAEMEDCFGLFCLETPPESPDPSPILSDDLLSLCDVFSQLQTDVPDKDRDELCGALDHLSLADVHNTYRTEQITDTEISSSLSEPPVANLPLTTSNIQANPHFGDDQTLGDIPGTCLEANPHSIYKLPSPIYEHSLGANYESDHSPDMDQSDSFCLHLLFDPTPIPHERENSSISPPITPGTQTNDPSSTNILLDLVTPSQSHVYQTGSTPLLEKSLPLSVGFHQLDPQCQLDVGSTTEPNETVQFPLIVEMDPLDLLDPSSENLQDMLFAKPQEPLPPDKPFHRGTEVPPCDLEFAFFGPDALGGNLVSSEPSDSLDTLPVADTDQLWSDTGLERPPSPPCDETENFALSRTDSPLESGIQDSASTPFSFGEGDPFLAFAVDGESPSAGDELARLRAVFNALDRDKDGFVKTEDFVQFATVYGAEQVKYLTGYLDPAGLGVINFRDFYRGISEIQNEDLDIHLYDMGYPSEGEPACSVDFDDLAAFEGNSLQPKNPLRDYFQKTMATSTSLVRLESLRPEGLELSLCDISLVTITGQEEQFEDFGEGAEPDLFSNHCEDEQEHFNQTSSSPQRLTPSGAPVPDRQLLAPPPCSALAGMYCSQCHKHINRLEDLSTRLRYLEMDSPDKRMSSRKEARRLHNSGFLEDSSEQQLTDMPYNDADLTDKVVYLEQKVSELERDAATTSEQQNRLRQENLHLLHRAHALEEQLKDQELRSDEVQSEETRKHRDEMRKMERDRAFRLSSLKARVQELENENTELRSQLPSAKATAQRLEEGNSLQPKITLRDYFQKTMATSTSLEKLKMLDELEELHQQLKDHQEQNIKLGGKLSKEMHKQQTERERCQEVIEELRRELEQMQLMRLEMEQRMGLGNSAALQEYNSRTREAELEQEVRRLKEEQRTLKEQNEELNGQIINLSIQGAKNLFSTTFSDSLAAEISSVSRDELMEAIQKQEEINLRLQDYIDRIIVAIMETNPAILEDALALYGFLERSVALPMIQDAEEAEMEYSALLVTVISLGF